MYKRQAGKGFAVVAEEIRVLAEQSKDAVANIQAVTENVDNAVGNLTKDSNRLLNFVDTDIVKSFDEFEKMADDYNMDASKINDLVSDFSATSEELVASISLSLIHIYNYGAGEYDRVKKITHTSMGLIALVMVMGMVISCAIPQQLMGLFTTSRTTMEIGGAALRIISFGFVVSSVSVTFSGVLEGCLLYTSRCV